MKIRTELKKAIINWLFENQTRWQRMNVCIEEFREYIFNSKGEYLIGGEDVGNFIRDIEKLIFEE